MLIIRCNLSLIKLFNLLNSKSVSIKLKMSYKTILFSKLLETDLLFDNMGPVAQRLEYNSCTSLIIDSSIRLWSNSQWWFGHKCIKLSLLLISYIKLFNEKSLIGFIWQTSCCLYGLRVQVPSQVPSILKC